MISNPVLPGFHPDPSILRVGDDYYLATSTFEWHPGVRLHHSTDLVHWRPAGAVLTHQLDMDGNPDSGGIWAPCLSYADGTFYVIYTDVKAYAGGFWDTPNFVVTAPSIEGPWSEPVRVHARGFDPSLFHDDDGRSWMISNRTDWRPGKPWAAGIIVQEYDRAARTLVGEPIDVYAGTPAGMTEGPHLYKKDGWYYLLTAEGGTEWFHQVTVARSRSLLGPYEHEATPAAPLITSVHRPDLTLQKAGHGSLVETQDGEWFLAHLAARPLGLRGPCILGRETSIQRVTWTPQGWPRIEDGVPHEQVRPPALPAQPWPSTPETDDFGGTELGPHWATLRRPADTSWVSVTGGGLRIAGGRSPASLLGPSLVARRVQHLRATFEATVEYAPTSSQQMAGITAYYNSRNWYLLRIGHDGTGTIADVLSCDHGVLRSHGPSVPVSGPARLRFDLDEGRLRASYGEAEWGPLDATILSDEHAAEADAGVPRTWGFTGAFFGLWSIDMTGGNLPALFSAATYKPQP